jgi:hypothetical protein
LSRLNFFGADARAVRECRSRDLRSGQRDRGDYEPYLGSIDAAPCASAEAATVAAAHSVLTEFLPDQLLRSLERLGYLVRSDAPAESGARIVRFTRRGRAAYATIHDILRDIEREWSTVLGPQRFAELKELLLLVWESPLARRGGPRHSQDSRMRGKDPQPRESTGRTDGGNSR